MIVTQDVGEVTFPDYPTLRQREFLGPEGLNSFSTLVNMGKRNGKDVMEVTGAEITFSIGSRQITLHTDRLGIKAYLRKINKVLVAVNFYLTAYDEFRNDTYTKGIRRVETRIYRKFLNSGGTSSGGTIFAYIHRTYWKVKGEEEFRKDVYAFIEIADCMYKIRLYNPWDRTKPDEEIVKMKQMLETHIAHVHKLIQLQGKTHEEVQAILSAAA